MNKTETLNKARTQSALLLCLEHSTSLPTAEQRQEPFRALCHHLSRTCGQKQRRWTRGQEVRVLFQEQAAHSLGRPAEQSQSCSQLQITCNPPRNCWVWRKLAAVATGKGSKWEAAAGWLLPTKAESCMEAEGWGKGAESSDGKAVTFSNHPLVCTVET